MKPPFDVPCVIVAGGKSSRMGRDKALLPFGGYETLTQFQVERLKPLFNSLHVSTKSAKFPFNVPLIIDEDSDISSPMVAFYSILKNFKNTYVFILSVDTPFVKEKEISKLFLNVEGDVTIAEDKNKKHPLCGLYHTRILSHIEKALYENKHTLGKLLDKIDTNFVTFEDEEPFFNLNYTKEYEKAVKCIK